MTKRSRWTGAPAVVLGCSLLAAVAMTLAGAGVAAAQGGPNDPYSGGGVTPPAVTLHLTITVAPNPARPGETVTATVCGAASGLAIQVTFDGGPVATGTAGADGCARISFVVPAGAAALGPPGGATAARPELAVVSGLGDRMLGFLGIGDQTAVDHQVCALAAGAVPACTTLVLTAATPAVLTVPTPTGGHLAFTGIDLALMVAVAMVLILAGSYLVQRSRKTRRSRSRRHRRPEVTV